MLNQHLYNFGMAIQIANPDVVANIERLSSLTGLTKTAAVGLAVERLLDEARTTHAQGDFMAQASRILAQFDAIAHRPGAVDPLEWDEHGLPV